MEPDQGVSFAVALQGRENGYLDGLAEAVFRHSPLPALVTDITLNVLALNPAAERALDLDAAQYLSSGARRPLSKFIAGSYASFLDWVNADDMSGFEVLLYGGSLTKYIAFRKAYFFDNKSYLIFNLVPVDDFHTINLDQIVSSTIYRYSRLGIYVTDEHQRIINANPGFMEIFGLNGWEVSGKAHIILYDDSSSEVILTDVISAMSEKGYWKGRVVAKNARDVRFSASLSVIESSSPNRVTRKPMFIHILENIQEQVEFENDLINLVKQDNLTGLLNREGFGDAFDELFDGAMREGANLYLMFIDLNEFKKLNDTYGHLFGDKVLIAVAKRLRGCLKAQDIVGRFGGDEFVAAFRADSAPERVAQKVIEQFREPMRIGDIVLEAAISVGVVGYPDDTMVKKEMFAAADFAMYSAKAVPGNGYKLFSETDQEEFRLFYPKLINSL